MMRAITLPPVEKCEAIADAYKRTAVAIQTCESSNVIPIPFATVPCPLYVPPAREHFAQTFHYSAGCPTLLQGRGCAWEPLDWVVTAPSTISDAIRVRATLDPQRPAIVSTDLPTLTFGELDCTIRQIGDELKNAKRMDYEPSTWRRAGARRS